MNLHYPGELAYFDSIARGLVPCRVIGVEPSQQLVRIKMTATRAGYPRGYEFTSSSRWVIPRTSIVKRNRRYRIQENYQWTTR